MTPGYPCSTWSCCCTSFNCSACRYGTLTGFTGRATLSQTCCFWLTLSHASGVSTSECSAMKSQLPFTPESLTCCPLYNHWWWLWLLLDLAGHLWKVETSWPCTVTISTRHSQKRTGHPSELGSPLGFFLGSCLSRFFLVTVLLHLHCLPFRV